MTIALAPPYDDLTFLTPLCGGRAETFVEFLAGGSPGTVLDIGCGWAELLLRVVAAAPTCTGTGVDTDEPSIEHGRQLAERRGLTERVTLACGDGKDHIPARAYAMICIGASQVWDPPAQENQPLDYLAALRAVRAMVPRGARVVYGEGVWSQPPTPEAVASLSGRLDELVPTGELVSLAVTAGFMPVAVHEASLDEWDAFESGYSACYATWLAEHQPDHPDAPEVRAMAARQRDGYFGGYRTVMGMAYLQLLAV